MPEKRPYIGEIAKDLGIRRSSSNRVKIYSKLETVAAQRAPVSKYYSIQRKLVCEPLSLHRSLNFALHFPGAK